MRGDHPDLGIDPELVEDGHRALGGRDVGSAPDDDPEFLGRIGTVSDQDERIRRLEEELAQLDAEDEDPRWTAPPGPAVTGGASAAPSPGTPGAQPPARPADGDDDTRGQRGALS